LTCIKQGWRNAQYILTTLDEKRMQALQLNPRGRLSGTFVPATGSGKTVATLSASEEASGDVDRRIEKLTRIRNLGIPLTVGRERNFWHVIDNALIAAKSGNAAAVASAAFALDILALELCDE
jgi:hypothetical protein